MPADDPLHPLRILLIEDTPDDERLALRALRGCDRPLAVRVARHGHHARRVLGFDGGPDGDGRAAPDLVVSDLKLPGLDGRELLCLVRESARLARVPYLIFSSSNERGDVDGCLGCGADAFVQKPVDYAEYLDCLRRAVPWALDGFAPSDAPPFAVARPRPGGTDGRAA